MLRKMLQRGITKLETEADDVWQNAVLHIHDPFGNIISVQSGEGGNVFYIYVDGRYEIQVYCKKRVNTQGIFGRIRTALSMSESSDGLKAITL